MDKCVVVGIDPGTEQSAYVEIEMPSWKVLQHEIVQNDQLLGILDDGKLFPTPSRHHAIEMLASYGMAVGAEVFMTAVWIGRFLQALEGDATLVYRREVKLALCNSPRANDSNVRQALIDRYGPGKAKAIGLKASPGPLYGIRKDEWQALGVAVTHAIARGYE